MDRPEPDTRSSAETEDQIRAVVAGVRGVLGADLVGVYLHGSGVLGGFRQDSDIDVLVVSTRHTIAEEKQHLVHLLLSISGSGAAVRPGRPIELSIVVWSEVRPWRYHPGSTSTTANSGGAASSAERSSHGTPPQIETSHPPSRWCCSETGRWPGHRPGRSSIPCLAVTTWTRSSETSTPSTSTYRGDARNVVLTLPRIWSAIATDAVLSKEDAATWALPRLPEEHRGVLELARAAYRGDTKDSWDDLGPEARAYADHVVSEIARALSEADHPM